MHLDHLETGMHMSHIYRLKTNNFVIKVASKPTLKCTHRKFQLLYTMINIKSHIYMHVHACTHTYTERDQKNRSLVMFFLHFVVQKTSANKV